MARLVDCKDSSFASRSEGGNDSKEIQFASARIIDIEKGGEEEGEGGIDNESKGHSEELQCVSVDTVEKGRKGDEEADYDRRSQWWLRAATLGANYGLLIMAYLMMVMAVVNSGAVVLSGMASLVAGACSMAIREFLSMSTQRDIEAAAKRRRRHLQLPVDPASAQVFPAEAGDEEERLPSAWLAAGASAASFSVGAAVPLLAAAFIPVHVVRQVVHAATATVALAVIGAAGTHFGGASAARGCVRFVIGGWAAMLLHYGVLKAFSRFGHLSGSSGFA